MIAMIAYPDLTFNDTLLNKFYSEVNEYAISINMYYKYCTFSSLYLLMALLATYTTIWGLK